MPHGPNVTISAVPSSSGRWPAVIWRSRVIQTSRLAAVAASPPEQPLGHPTSSTGIRPGLCAPLAAIAGSLRAQRDGEDRIDGIRQVRALLLDGYR